MATRIAIAQRKAAAMERINRAAGRLEIDPPPAPGKADPDTQIAAILEWIAGVLESAAAAAPVDAPAPAPRRTRKEAPAQ